MNGPAQRLALVLARLLVRPGHAFAGQDPAPHAANLAWIIRRGQYVMLTDRDDRLLGFCGWWLLDDAGLALLREGGAQALLRQTAPTDLASGRHAHIAAAVTAPWAPGATYRALIDLTKRALSGRVDSMSTMMAKRDGRTFWHERRVAA